MKREIKFRAWHRESKIMYWWELLWGNHSRGNGYIGMVPIGELRETHHSYDGNQILVDPTDCDILQYTGLTVWMSDAYEGDIVESDINMFDKSQGKHRRSIYFKDGQFMIGSVPLHIILHSTFNARIIGNIYENPELLK